MLIPVRPKNYRSIALAAIARSDDPIVFMDGRRVTDYSTNGPMTQKGIRSCRNFEIRDGATPILGFHDHPDEMWIAGAYQDFANYCAREGWLKIQGAAK
jgi:hypothetical protein